MSLNTNKTYWSPALHPSAIERSLGHRLFSTELDPEKVRVTLAESADAAEEPTVESDRWSGVLVMEGEPTGDGRFIEPNALSWDDLPIPLRYAPVDTGGHDGAQVVGHINSIERGQGGRIEATGDFDLGSDVGREAMRHVKENLTPGVSVDMDDVAFEVRVAKDVLDEQDAMLESMLDDEEEPERETDDEGRVTVVKVDPDDELMVVTEARIRAATLVAIPAFAQAKIAVDESEPAEAPPTNEQPTEDQDESLAASAGPIEPPSDWFTDPGLSEPTPIHVTAQGRVYGHLAAWGTCHTGFAGECVTPPSSATDYGYFHVGSTICDDGTEVSTGRLTMDTRHAAPSASPTGTMAHYDHTGLAVADVRAGEDAHGIWVAGAVRPNLTPEQVRTLRASPLSGDWRRIDGNLELVAALAVNSPGFPIPHGQQAAGRTVALMASGVLQPDEKPSMADALDGAKVTGVEQFGLGPDEVAFIRRQARDDRRKRATAMRQRVKVAAMAAKIRKGTSHAL